MFLTLPPGEPAAGPWRSEPVEVLVRLLMPVPGVRPERPWVVAVDGRGGSGKTTLAACLHAAVPESAVVHTDDIAWHHSFFDWADLLADGVLAPLRRGESVRYRPPGWDVQGRPGAVEVPAGRALVLVEGVGAGRRELAHLLDAVVWVQSDAVEAERRGLERDVAQGMNGDHPAAARFWREWMAQELPFLDRQRPWERALVIVAGTRQDPGAPGQLLLAPPPPQSRPH